MCDLSLVNDWAVEYGISYWIPLRHIGDAYRFSTAISGLLVRNGGRSFGMSEDVAEFPE